MFSDLLNRHPRHHLLIELNPYQVLVARVGRDESGRTLLQAAAEFDRNDQTGLTQWLSSNFPHQKAWVPTICGVVPAEGLLQRESMSVRKIGGADSLTALVREKYKIGNAEEWRLRALSPVDGTPLPADNLFEPALVCGIPNREVALIEQRLFEQRLRPARLELSLLSLFGAVFHQLARRDEKSAAVVVSIEDDQTVAYILGKEGVYTPAPVRFGLNSILAAARKELNLAEDVDVLAFLRQPTQERHFLAPKFVRTLARALKPVIDSYEMTIGQPAGGIYCAYLPADLAWIAAPLAEAVERPALAIDCGEWMPSVGLQAVPGLPVFGPHWLGALSLVAAIPGQTPHPNARQDLGERPWHVDCQLSADLPKKQLVGRPFITGAIAVALAAFAITITFWQHFASNSLRADTAYWEAEMEKNRKLFDELSRASAELKERSARLDAAYDLMASPYQVTDFVMNLGRTLPRNTRIDRIELSQGKIALSGALREPSETASSTLNRYLEQLRGSSAIGPLFSSIGLTALQREPDSDAMAFEVTFRLKSSQP